MVSFSGTCHPATVLVDIMSFRRFHEGSDTFGYGCCIVEVSSLLRARDYLNGRICQWLRGNWTVADTPRTLHFTRTPLHTLPLID